MKTLFAIRHAEAQAGYSTDFERTLTPHGVAQTANTARFIADSLNAENVLFLHSNAVRTTQTCQLIREHLKSSAPIQSLQTLYNSPLQNYLQAIEQVSNNYQTVILVGHNPTISQLIAHISGELIGYLTPSGGAELNLNCHNWNEVSTYATLVNHYQPSSF